MEFVNLISSVQISITFLFEQQIVVVVVVALRTGVYRFPVVHLSVDFVNKSRSSLKITCEESGNTVSSELMKNGQPLSPSNNILFSAGVVQASEKSRHQKPIDY